MIIVFLSQWSFGQNKVEYKEINWRILDTEHFKIYHYQGGEGLADFAALVLEEAFNEFKDYFPGSVKGGEKVPVLIYVSYKDFQQTNVSPYLIPEGVGGFTEGFKKRVVVPFAGNYEEFRHVLRHELVHAFQFGYSRGLGGLVQSQPPQWFIEGMAEYLAQNWSLRTETYMRDLVVNLKLPTLEEMNYYSGYVSYRYGHAFFKFLEEIYGEKAVKDFIRMGMGGNVEAALARITGKKLPELSEEFSMYIKGKVLKVFGYHGFPQDAKRITSRRDNSFLNVGSAISPDGSFIAFISDRKGRMGIWVLNLANRKLTMIQEGERSPDFENLHVLKPSLSISKNNLLAVISQGTYSDILSVYDLRKFKRVKRFELKDLDGVHGGELSPDGRMFVFVGYRKGIPDVFVLDLQTGKVQNLTNDEFTEDDPSWFDDSTVIFVSDKNESGKIGSYAIFKRTLNGREDKVFGYRRFLKKPKRVGDRIVFIAEYNGCTNLFSFENGRTKILTRYFTEIGDYDVSDGGRWVISALWEGGWDIFFFLKFPEDGEEITLENEEGIPLEDRELDLVKEPLSFNLSLDLAYGGLSYSSLYGTVGALVMLFSDIPGDNWIIAQIIGQSNSIENSQFIINYYNFKGRVDKGLNLYQLFNFRYFRPYVIYEKRLGTDIFASYPFNRFFRFETGISYHYNTWVNLHLDTLDFYCGISFSPDCIPPRINYPKGFEGFFGLFYDDAIINQYGSAEGIRWHLGVFSYFPPSQIFNRSFRFIGMAFRSLTPRTIWANLLILSKSFGKHAELYSASGPFGIRAYPEPYYIIYDINEKRYVHVLMGNNLIQYTTELRFPFIDRLRFGFLPLEFRNLRALFFLDAGNAWFSGDEAIGDKYARYDYYREGLGFFPINLKLLGRKYDIFMDMGFGLRLSFGYPLYIPLRLDWAFPVDERGLIFPGRLVLSFGWDF